MAANIIFIVWARHSRRAETLAHELSGQVSFHYEAQLRRGWLTPMRYLLQSGTTWQTLSRVRPNAVIVQLPPIFALLVVAAWCGWQRMQGRKVPYAIDCHTGTFFDRRWRWALPLLRLLSQYAAITIVASEEAQKTLRRWNRKSLFLIDGLPNFGLPSGNIGVEGEKRVAVINGFGTDEPTTEMLAATRLLPEITFYFSGDHSRRAIDIREHVSSNVIFTGFLCDSEYVGLLTNVHGIVDLTREPNILTCGAYEALAVGKPVVTSDRPQMKRFFSRGFIYVENTPEAIAAGIRKMLNDQVHFATEVRAMRTEFMLTRRPAFEQLADILHA